MDSVSHSDASIIQQFHEAGHYTHIVSLFGQQLICLARSVCCFCGHSSLRRRLTVAFQKASAWVAGASLFQSSLKYGGYLQMLGVSRVRLKMCNCLFSDHQQTAVADTRGLLVERMTKVPVHVLAWAQSSLSRHKDRAVSLTYTHHH